MASAEAVAARLHSEALLGEWVVSRPVHRRFPCPPPAVARLTWPMEDVLLLHSMDPSAMALSQDSIATTAAEALCCSMTQACSSDTSSGPVPTLDGVTIVPVANLSSVSG